MKKVSYLAIFLPFFSISNALAQSDICPEFLKNPVFTKEIYEKNVKSSNDFKSLLCSASWKSASEAQNAGIDATIPIYDLTIPFTANWNNSRVEEWKTNNCSSEEAPEH